MLRVPVTLAILAVLAYPHPHGIQPQGSRCATPMKLGFEDEDRLLYRADRTTGRVYDRFAQAGGCVVRFIVGWGTVENADGSWYFDRRHNKLDRAVRTARRRGFQVLLTLTGSNYECIDSGGRVGLFNPRARTCADDSHRDGDHLPCGAPPGDQTRPTYVAPDPRCFARFVGATVRHFRGQVDSYSLWNEPNHPSFLRGTRPEDYRALYTAGYAAAKRADPASRVLIGDLSPGPRNGRTAPQWLEAVAAPGQRLHADGVAWHPYQLSVPPTRPEGGGYAGIGDTAVVQSTIDRLWRERRLTLPGGGRPPLLFTEFGYLLRGNPRRPRAQVLDDTRRAPWLGQALDIAGRQRSELTVLYTGTEHGPAAYPPYRRDDYGLFSPEGEVRGVRPYGSGDRTRRAYCEGIIPWALRSGHAVSVPPPC